MTRTLNPLRDAALAYAARGWAVFPCAREGKVPLGRLAPHGVKDATAEPETVARWWAAEPTANIGLATGPVSGVVVLDADGDTGRHSLGELLRHVVALPATVAAETGGGGWHVYFALPDGTVVRNSAGKLGPGLDVRGEGGYVVAPPSVHPNGRPYRWLVSPEHGPVAPLPGGLLGLLAPPRVERAVLEPGPPRFTDGAGSAYGLAALRGELERLASAPAGQRNDALNRAAHAAGGLAAGGELDAHAAAEALAHVALGVGLGGRETAQTLASGMRAGMARPRRAPERSAGR